MARLSNGNKKAAKLVKKRQKNLARVEKLNKKGIDAGAKGNFKKKIRKFKKADKVGEKRAKFTKRMQKK
jgi:hypothetical protein